MAELLCHVTTRAALVGAALVGEPFLHCCTEAQLAFVLGRHFAGRTGLVVLRFDPASVVGEVRWVRSEPDQAAFPHVYGALPLAGMRLEQAPSGWGEIASG